MNTRKTTICSAIALAIGTAGTPMTASALSTASVLLFDTGIYSCIAGAGTPPDNCVYGTNVKTGSFFGMDANGNDSIQAFEKTALEAFDGLVIGGTQAASGSHSTLPIGAPTYTGTFPIQTGTDGNGNPEFQTDGNGNQVTQTVTEVPGIDEPWGFFGNTGLHFTTVATNIIGDDGTADGTVDLDFSGWDVTWNGIPLIPMTGGAWDGNPSGVANVTCGSDYTLGDTFVLNYSATVPNNDPSGFGNVKYQLYLEGTVVPVPAAVWLFGSGLLGLAGIARRKKKV
jgi:hypothetical protein